MMSVFAECFVLTVIILGVIILSAVVPSEYLITP
jgi:hypothetical protein